MTALSHSASSTDSPAGIGCVMRFVRWFRRQFCKVGIHDKRTGAHVIIKDDVWHVSYEYRCRRCPVNLGDRSCTYPPNA
jgi:hypothetical protein